MAKSADEMPLTMKTLWAASFKVDVNWPNTALDLRELGRRLNVLIDASKEVCLDADIEGSNDDYPTVERKFIARLMDALESIGEGKDIGRGETP